MTIENIYNTARWANSLLDEEKENCKYFSGFAREQAVKNYYYLTGWIDTFNRYSQGLNWNESHIIYKEAIVKLTNHCTNL